MCDRTGKCRDCGEVFRLEEHESHRNTQHCPECRAERVQRAEEERKWLEQRQRLIDEEAKIIGVDAATFEWIAAHREDY